MKKVPAILSLSLTAAISFSISLGVFSANAETPPAAPALKSTQTFTLTAPTHNGGTMRTGIFIATSDNGFVTVIGEGYTVGTDEVTSYSLVKYKSDGTIQWSKPVSNSYNFFGQLCETSDGQFLMLAGYQDKYFTPSNVSFIRYDKNGNVVWTIPVAKYDKWIGSPTPDGGVIFGQESVPSTLFKIDKDGNITQFYTGDTEYSYMTMNAINNQIKILACNASNGYTCVSLDSNGTVISILPLNIPAPTDHARYDPLGVSIDGHYIFVKTTYEPTSDTTTFSLISFDESSKEQWTLSDDKDFVNVSSFGDKLVLISCIRSDTELPKYAVTTYSIVAPIDSSSESSSSSSSSSSSPSSSSVPESSSSSVSNPKTGEQGTSAVAYSVLISACSVAGIALLILRKKRA